MIDKVDVKKMKVVAKELNSIVQPSIPIDLDAAKDVLYYDIREVCEMLEEGDEITSEAAKTIKEMGFTIPAGVSVQGDAEKKNVKKPASEIKMPKLEPKKEKKKAEAAPKAKPKKKAEAKPVSKKVAKKPAAKATEKKEVKKPAKKTQAKPVKTGTKNTDKFGLRADSKRSKVAMDLSTGKFTMSEIKEKYGDTHYNLLRQLEKNGYTVSYTKNKKIRVTKNKK
jgi:hypothetical protein